jgi:hypothetical protein
VVAVVSQAVVGGEVFGVVLVVVGEEVASTAEVHEVEVALEAHSKLILMSV